MGVEASSRYPLLNCVHYSEEGVEKYLSEVNNVLMSANAGMRLVEFESGRYGRDRYIALAKEDEEVIAVLGVSTAVEQTRRFKILSQSVDNALGQLNNESALAEHKVIYGGGSRLLLKSKEDENFEREIGDCDGLVTGTYSLIVKLEEGKEVLVKLKPGEIIRNFGDTRTLGNSYFLSLEPDEGKLVLSVTKNVYEIVIDETVSAPEPNRPFVNPSGKRTRPVYKTVGDGRNGIDGFEFEKGVQSNPARVKIRHLWDKLSQYADLKKRVSVSEEPQENNYL